MKDFFTKLFHKKKQSATVPVPEATLPETEADREIEALYGILADILGSDKLVIKAGKMDAMTLMRSPLRGERVLALQRIILENPTIEEVPTEEDIPEILHCTGLTRRPVFIPAVGNFAQGMLVQCPLHLDLLPGAPKAADLHDALASHYAQTNTSANWVSVLPPTDDNKLAADTLANTNKLELRVFANEQYRQAVLIARLDNLGKGASGAAVQNLQIMLGL